MASETVVLGVAHIVLEGKIRVGSWCASSTLRQARVQTTSARDFVVTTEKAEYSYEQLSQIGPKRGAWTLLQR